jgi:broad specificity phosphatase PhoE
MARLVLVRHGEPDASWGEHPDPGLSPMGVGQAEEAAGALAGFAGAELVTSPLRRARETAAPLTRQVGRPAHEDARFGEIATPAGLTTPRVDWLRGVLAGRWEDTDPETRAWRDGLLEAVRAIRGVTIAFTHFVAINVAVGAATGDDRVWVSSPAHASITILDVVGTDLSVLDLGDQSAARVR